MYTVKQLSHLAGITPRTLHYYDGIGLLKPSLVGENGYRYYGQEALLRLQQILFYRELDLPLEEIRLILADPGFNVLAALESHKVQLRGRMAKMERLIATVDETILHMKGEKVMSEKKLFAAFSEEEQEALAQEAEQTYDVETVRASMKKWKGYSEAEKQRIMDEGSAIYLDMVKAMPEGAAAPEVQAIVARWRQHMDYFWTPGLEQLVPLASGYSDDPRFKANFDKIHPGLAAFMREAVQVYVDRQTK